MQVLPSWVWDRNSQERLGSGAVECWGLLGGFAKQEEPEQLPGGDLAPKSGSKNPSRLQNPKLLKAFSIPLSSLCHSGCGKLGGLREGMVRAAGSCHGTAPFHPPCPWSCSLLRAQPGLAPQPWKWHSRFNLTLLYTRPDQPGAINQSWLPNISGARSEVSFVAFLN